MIKKITPRMQQALRDGKDLVFFADIGLAVLNDTVDTQADFQASVLQSNMDFTETPGTASLALQAENINQTAGSSYTLFSGSGVRWQSFLLTGGRWIDSLTVWFRHSALLGAFTVSLFDSTQTTSLYSWVFNVPGGYDAEKTFTASNLYLDAGVYYIKIEMTSPASVEVKYSSADVYADGAFSIGGDLYFKIAMRKFYASGFFVTKTLDLGEAPVDAGTFQLSYSLPADCGLDVTLYGSATGAFAGEEAAITGAEDGMEVPAYQYWRCRFDLYSNAALDATPQIDMAEFLYSNGIHPAGRLLVRENRKLSYVEDDILDFSPLMSPVGFQMSELKIIERVASGGNITLELSDSVPDELQRVIAGSPLKNYRAAVYIGADVPGFSRSDLLRFFIGIIDSVKIKPKYRGSSYGISLTVKNPILELKRKAPLPEATGLVDLANISLNYDGWHVIDAALDIMRGGAGIPARYINLESWNSARFTIGDANLPAAAHLIRRSYAVGLPDTRIKSPEEVSKLLQPLAFIADGYVVVDEDSRITFIKHDAAAAAEETWADETLVRDGLDAVAIEAMDEILLGYDDLLYNMVILGCEWDGSGGDWKAFSKVYADLGANSADDFAPGKAIYISPMSGNNSTIEASKWLGPESGYNGETIAQKLGARLRARYEYPPVRLKGVVVPVSQFMRSLGDVVAVQSEEVCKFGRRRIALSETVKFMITSKKYDRGRKRMIFDLMELT